MIQLIIFGYAVNLDVENSRLAWMDQDRTPASRELRAAFEGSRYFRIVATPASDAQVRGLMDAGDVDLTVRVLPGFARDIERGRTTAVQVLIDGTNSNSGSIVAGYANGVISGYAAKALTGQQRTRTVAAGQPVYVPAANLQTRTRVWFNPALKSRVYFVPGVVVNIIALVTIMLTAMSIVREKEIGTMEQLMVTPIRPIELMLGKLLPFAMIGLVQVTLITILARVLFAVPFRGSVVMLYASAALFLLTTLGVGLFISTISQTQQQAMMSSFMFFMPAFMLSGFAFPIRNMPVAVQFLTYIDPLRYFMEIVRGLFLKGAGLAVLWPQMLALAGIGVAVMAGSALRFHKRLD
jgi:ABC-2 type transport system permease protein